MIAIVLLSPGTPDPFNTFVSTMSSTLLPSQKLNKRVELDVKLQHQQASSACDTICGTLLVTTHPAQHPAASDGISGVFDGLRIDKVLVSLEGTFHSSIPFSDQEGDPVYGPGFNKTDKVSIKFLDQIHNVDPSSYRVLGTGSGPSRLEYPFFFKLPNDMDKFDERIVAVPSSCRVLDDGLDVSTLPPSVSIPYLNIEYKLKVLLQYHDGSAASPVIRRVERNLEFLPFTHPAPPTSVEDYPDELQVEDICPVESCPTFGAHRRVGTVRVEVVEQPRPVNMRRAHPVTLTGSRSHAGDNRGSSSLSLQMTFTPSLDLSDEDVAEVLRFSHLDVKEYLHTQTFNSTKPMNQAPTVKAARASQTPTIVEGDGVSPRTRIRYHGHEELLHSFDVDARSWNEAPIPSPPFTEQPSPFDAAGPAAREYISSIKLPIPVGTDDLCPSFRAQLAERRYIVELRIKVRMGKGKYQAIRMMKVRVPLQVINSQNHTIVEDRRESATGDPMDVEFDEVGDRPPEYVGEMGL